MSFNLRTEDARQREVLTQNRMQDALGRRLYRETRINLNRTGKDAAAAFREAGEAGVAIVLERHASSMKRILHGSWADTMDAFGLRLMQGGKSAHRFGTETKSPVVFEEFVRGWIETIGLRKVVQITGTTRSLIASVIEANVAAGIDVIARSIVDETTGSIARYRASVIARTETHGAANAAAQGAVDAMGLTHARKEWITAGDDRARDTHVEADGQTVPKHERFHVGGAHLMHPGDPTGPAKEIIHCRCAMGFITE